MNSVRSARSARPVRPMSFEVDDRVTIKIDPDLALDLADLIFDADTENPALLALAHKLRSLDKSIGDE